MRDQAQPPGHAHAEVGHKAFRGELIRSLPLVSEGFSFGRTYDEGKKIAWHDGVIAVWTLLRYRVRR